MKILSIETSCDDTGISIIEAKGGIKNASFIVLANNVSSQISIHIPYGGVFPSLAKREHIKNLPIIFEKTLREAKLEKEKKPFDLIAVTYGPGLEPTLWTGIAFAKELAKKFDVPVFPVNHMEGHIFSIFANNKKSFKISKIKYPILSLLVSGGHTELVLTEKWMNYKIIGQTLDDAAGEAFDKVARMLGLPYPGGPQISRLAKEERKNKKNYSFKLPRPMLHSKDLNFSFSGLKTAVLYLVRNLVAENKIDKKTKSQIALEFENAAVESLTYKTMKAVEKYKIKTLVVAGGVSANDYLKKEIQKNISKMNKGKLTKIKLFFPQKEHSGDNSLMIGVAGYLNYMKNKKRVPGVNSIKATGNLRF